MQIRKTPLSLFLSMVCVIFAFHPSAHAQDENPAALVLFYAQTLAPLPVVAAQPAYGVQNIFNQAQTHLDQLRREYGNGFIRELALETFGAIVILRDIKPFLNPERPHRDAPLNNQQLMLYEKSLESLAVSLTAILIANDAAENPVTTHAKPYTPGIIAGVSGALAPYLAFHSGGIILGLGAFVALERLGAAQVKKDSVLPTVLDEANYPKFPEKTSLHFMLKGAHFFFYNGAIGGQVVWRKIRSTLRSVVGLKDQNLKAYLNDPHIQKLIGKSENTDAGLEALMQLLVDETSLSGPMVERLPMVQKACEALLTANGNVFAVIPNISPRKLLKSGK